ncbi:unnamed protein product [Sphagnum jensenii]|uniref:Uncharacterized protein n=1 Tax=Sphagnum jensenii TaxID=128206 RepID=A0ABP0VK56_9BRYO
MLPPGLKAIKVNGHELQVDFVSRNFMAVDIPTRINLTVIGAASTNTAEDEMSCIDTISIPIILCNRYVVDLALTQDEYTIHHLDAAFPPDMIILEQGNAAWRYQDRAAAAVNILLSSE